MKQAGPDIEQRAVVANVRYNVKRLEQATPILAEMVATKKLRVVGGVYDLPTGRLPWFSFGYPCGSNDLAFIHVVRCGRTPISIDAAAIFKK